MKSTLWWRKSSPMPMPPRITISSSNTYSFAWSKRFWRWLTLTIWWFSNASASGLGFCRSDPQRPYCTALAAQEAKITDPDLTPAARLLAELARDDESFFDLGLRMSQLHRSYFLELYSPNESRQLEFAQEADASLTEQARIEGADRLTFGEYLAQYFAG